MQGMNDAPTVRGDGHATPRTSIWQYATLWRQPAKMSEGNQSEIDHTSNKEEVAIPASPISSPKIGKSRRSGLPFELSPKTPLRRTSAFIDHVSPEIESPDRKTDNAGKAYGTLSRVKEKDRLASSVRLASASSKSPTEPPSPRAQASNEVADQRDPTPPGAWMSWATLRVPQTFSRGISSTLFASRDQGASGADRAPLRSLFASSGLDTVDTTAASPPDFLNLELHVDRVVQICGTDALGRTIVIMSAPCLPSSSEVSLDALLDAILAKLRESVEIPEGYILVLLASGAEHVKGDPGFKTPWPGWAWCWRVYKSLDRSYRKNLKKLLIVHPNWYTRNLVRLVTTGTWLVSPKFMQKIFECKSLAALATQIPLNRVELPARVLIADLRGIDPVVESPDPPQANSDADLQAFFTSIDVIAGKKGPQPLFDLEGIFRIPANASQLAAAKHAFRFRQDVDLVPFVAREPHLPAALIKASLRSLRPPLFPASTYSRLRAYPMTDRTATIINIKERILPLLQTESRRLLFVELVGCLHRIHAERASSRMDAANLAIVVAPSLVHSDDLAQDIAICAVPTKDPFANGKADAGAAPHGSLSAPPATLGTVLAFCIEHYHEVFGKKASGIQGGLGSPFPAQD